MGLTGRTLTAALIATAWALVLLVAAGPAAAAGTTVTMQGTEAPGTPPDLNKVFVTKFGPEKADRVLVLVPGTVGGAGDFTLVAQDIVSRVPNLQVWALDRRSQALEDTSLFAQALSGKASADQAFDYYLRWLVDPSVQPHYQPLDVSQFGFAADWGLEVALEDLRNVVKEAGRGGLYAFQTSLTQGDVLAGARRFVKRSAIRNGQATYVDGSATTSHLDPLTAAPEANQFLETVVRFLRQDLGR